MVIVTRVSTEDERCNNNILETVRRASHIARVFTVDRFPEFNPPREGGTSMNREGHESKVGGELSGKPKICSPIVLVPPS